MATLEIEVLDCFRHRFAHGGRLDSDELLTVSVCFIKTIQECRHGEPLDHDGRFILSAMAWEIARILNNKPEAPRPKLRLVSARTPAPSEI